MADVIIAMGSNLGDRSRMLRSAAEFLQSLSEIPILVSSNYETEPVGASTSLYLNAVVKIRTSIKPSDLLHQLKTWEIDAGRDPDAPRWTDRLIDLDIIDYGGRYHECAELIVPHPECLNRRFVLEPLKEIVPGWVHPTEGIRVDDALEKLP